MSGYMLTIVWFQSRLAPLWIVGTGIFIIFLSAGAASQAQSTSTNTSAQKGAATTAGTNQRSQPSLVNSSEAAGQGEALDAGGKERPLASSEKVQHIDRPGTPPHKHIAGEAVAPYVHETEKALPHQHEMTAHKLPGHTHPRETAGIVDPEGGRAHEGTLSVPDGSFVRILLLLTVGIAGLLVVLGRRALASTKETAEARGKNLLDVPLLGQFLRWRHFNSLLLVPTLLIFAFIVLAGLVGEQTSTNPAVLLTWILWWPAVIFTFFLGGRIWCTICPFGYLGDVAQKILSLRRKAPRILRNMWWRLALFLTLTWLTTLFALDRMPNSTAYLALALTTGAVVLGFVYEKRTFCRFVCPVGGIFGLYSMTAPVHLGVKDKHICQTECKGKDCHALCTWFQFPAIMQRNAECNLCLDCVRACPHDNLAFKTQMFATDLVQFQPRRKSLDEATTVAAILGVSLLQTVVMLNSWQSWQGSLVSLLHIPAGPALYTIVFLGFGVVVPLVVVGFVSYLSARGMASRPNAFAALRIYAYPFLPLGLGLHAAHNFHHLFGEGGALWQGVKAEFARYTGWGADVILTTAPPTPMAPNTLYFLQWLALIGGLYLAIWVGTRLVARNAMESRQAFGTALPIFLFAVAYTVLNVLVLAAPMAHRH